MNETERCFGLRDIAHVRERPERSLKKTKDASHIAPHLIIAVLFSIHKILRACRYHHDHHSPLPIALSTTTIIEYRYILYEHDLSFSLVPCSSHCVLCGSAGNILRCRDFVFSAVITSNKNTLSSSSWLDYHNNIIAETTARRRRI